MIYFTPDLHIGRNIKKSRKATALDSFSALQRMATMILDKHDCSSVILPGDIFDRNEVDGASIEAFTVFLDTLFDCGITVYTIQGNHDNGEKSISSALGAIDLNGKTVVVEGKRIHGLDYLPGPQLKEALKEVPPCDVLILHAGCLGIVDMEEMAEFRPEDVPEHIRNIVCGHIHMSEILKTGGRTVISTGVMHPTAIDQGGPYGLFRWDTVQDVWTMENIPNRPILRLDLGEEMPYAEIDCARRSSELVPIVEIKFPSDRWNDIRDLQREYADRCIFFEKPYTVSRMTDVTFQDQETDRKVSLLDALPFAVDPEEHSGEFALLKDMLGAEDPQVAADIFIQEGLVP